MVPGTRRGAFAQSVRLQTNFCRHALALALDAPALSEGGRSCHFDRPPLALLLCARQPLPMLGVRRCPLLVTPSEHRLNLVLLVMRHRRRHCMQCHVLVVPGRRSWFFESKPEIQVQIHLTLKM